MLVGSTPAGFSQQLSNESVEFLRLQSGNPPNYQNSNQSDSGQSWHSDDDRFALSQFTRINIAGRKLKLPAHEEHDNKSKTGAISAGLKRSSTFLFRQT